MVLTETTRQRKQHLTPLTRELRKVKIWNFKRIGNLAQSVPNPNGLHWMTTVTSTFMLIEPEKPGGKKTSFKIGRSKRAIWKFKPV